MDPIEAQIQAQLQSIQNNPNFSSYQPSFSDVGIAPLQSFNMSNNLVAEPTPNISDMAKTAGVNIIKNKAADLFAKKIGLETLPQGSFFGGSMLTNAFAPVALFSGLSAIKNKIANKNLNAMTMTASQMQEQNKQDNTGGYQGGYDSGFMEGKGTASEMGSS
tara:strand:+ start:162 stop:647 length:486 start_codon:yes stop_codon:yes gene_type:complete